MNNTRYTNKSPIELLKYKYSTIEWYGLIALLKVNEYINLPQEKIEFRKREQM